MKRTVSLLGFGILAGAMAFAQNTADNGATPPQASPPVTSQTPATSASPTQGTNSQAGTTPENPGMTEGHANQNAPTAAQGQLNNNTSATSPNTVPASPSSATPSNSTQQSQANCTQTKPLYECQATDIPWANPSGGNNSTPPPPH